MAAAGQVKTEKKINAALFDRIPPQALEAESAVLGSIMIDPEALGRIVEFVQPHFFYRTQHRKIFAAAITLYEKNDPIDLITLSEELKRRKELEEIGSSYFLTELAESIPSSANIEYHARIVREKYILRKLIEESANIARDCYEGEDDVSDILDRSEQRIFSLSDDKSRKGFEHISPIMHATFESIEKFHDREGSVTGVPTGFQKFDELTSGLQDSELVIVAGRPSMGKTAFCLNLARNAAIDGKIPVGFFSLEMSSQQLAMRLLTSEARVDAHRLRTGRLADEEWQQLSMRAGYLAEAPIYIDETPGLTVLELRSKARRMKKEYDIGLVVVDYLQLMQGPKGVESRQQEISTISRSLKALAKELDLPVLALSQLSRAVEMRGGERRPMLSDLRESGAIEQDADMVCFIYRPEFYMKHEEAEEKDLVGRAEVIIGKQRNGPIGTVNLTFIKQYARFENSIDEPVYT